MDCAGTKGVVCHMREGLGSMCVGLYAKFRGLGVVWEGRDCVLGLCKVREELGA